MHGHEGGSFLVFFNFADLLNVIFPLCGQSGVNRRNSLFFYLLYSTDRTQPNTKADPESGPQVRFGSASSPLFKNLRPLWVC